MFKKIHSNRDPSVTLWQELHREFGAYFERAGTRFGEFCVHYPRGIFFGMIAFLLLSCALSFTVFHRPGKGSAYGSTALHPKPNQVKSLHPMDKGFSRILATGAALKQTLALKQEVEAILAKGRLSHADSLQLEKALDSLAILQHHL